jgi:hypothetical protein
MSRCTATTLHVSGLKVRYATHRVWRHVDDGWVPVRHWSDLGEGGTVRVVDRRHTPDRAPVGCRLDVTVEAGTGRGRKGRQASAPVFDSVHDRATAATITFTDDQWDNLVAAVTGDAGLRADLSLDPGTPNRVLRDLHRSGLRTDYPLRNPSTPPDLLVEFAAIRHADLATTHPNWPDGHPVPDVSTFVSLWPGADINPVAFDRIVKALPDRLSHELAAHPATPPGVLRELLRRTEAHSVVRRALINPNTPVDVLRSRFNDRDRRADHVLLLRNPSAPADLLVDAYRTQRYLSQPSFEPVGVAVAAHHNTPPDVLDALACHDSARIAKAALANPNTPSATVHAALDHPAPGRRSAALANPALSVDDVEHHVLTHPGDLVWTLEVAPNLPLRPFVAALVAHTVDLPALHAHPCLPPEHRLVSNTPPRVLWSEVLNAAARLTGDGLGFVVAHLHTWPGTVGDLVDAADAVTR